jgi:LPS export ABC transporter protein LptC
MLAVFILIVVVCVSSWIWMNRPQTPEGLLSSLPKDVDLALEDLHYTHNEDGRAVWTLDAAAAEYQREAGLVDLNDVELTLHQSDGFGTVHLIADSGRFDQSASLVDAWGNVVLTSERGDQLYTESLKYNVANELLSTAEAFRYLSEGAELTGTGLNIDVSSGRLSVESDVWARYNLQQGPLHD